MKGQFFRRKKHKHLEANEFELIKEMLKIKVPYRWIKRASGRADRMIAKIQQSKDFISYRGY